MKDIVEIFGMLGGGLTTISFIPQVVKTWKTRSTRDLSMGMFLLFTLGLVFWLIYGIYMNALPIILANVTTLVLALSILVMKILFR